MNTSEIAIHDAMPKSRITRLVEEMNFALKNTDRKVIIDWGVASGKIFFKSLKRRGTGFVGAIRSLATATVKESVNTVIAVKKGNIKTHIVSKAVDVSIAVGKTKDNIVQSVKTIMNRVKQDPLAAGPELLVAVIGFYLGSGGLDGDGGIPDLDLELGVGAHRSIWFHSILPGAMAEAAVFSLATLVNSIHSKLPLDHDKLWDRLLAEYNHLSVAFASGACSGLAYHLIVDATWDSGKAYSDLPISMPIEGHQTIMGINAAIETIDIPNKSISKP